MFFFNTLQFRISFVLKEINTFIHQGYIQLMKNNIYSVTKDLYFTLFWNLCIK